MAGFNKFLMTLSASVLLAIVVSEPKASELDCSQMIVEAYANGVLYDLEGNGGKVLETPKAIVGPGYRRASDLEKELFALSVSCFYSQSPSEFVDVQIIDWRNGEVVGEILKGEFSIKDND